MKTRSIEILP